MRIGAQGRHVFYWRAGSILSNYLRKVDLIYVSVNSIILCKLHNSISLSLSLSLSLLSFFLSLIFLSSFIHSSLVKIVPFLGSRECGAKVELLTSKRLKYKFPWLNTDGIALGSYGYENEGWFDPWSLLSALKFKCIELGVDFVHGDVYNMAHEMILENNYQVH